MWRMSSSQPPKVILTNNYQYHSWFGSHQYQQINEELEKPMEEIAGDAVLARVVRRLH